MKQITEDYVSYEIAVLLKEKGFTEPVQKVYNNKGDIVETYCDYTNQYKYHDWLYPCPTHQMALKWLREVHKIVLDIGFEANKGWTFYVSRLITETLSDCSTYIVGIQHSVWSDDIQQPYYKEYEEAVEASLLYVLKNLI